MQRPRVAPLMGEDGHHVKEPGVHRDSDSQEPTLSDTRERGAGNGWGMPQTGCLSVALLKTIQRALLRDESGRLARRPSFWSDT
jgi:hypothetical protein